MYTEYERLEKNKLFLVYAQINILYSKVIEVWYAERWQILLHELEYVNIGGFDP